MGRKRQFVVAALVALSALSGRPALAADAARPAGSLVLSSGWKARLFLQPLERPAGALRADDDPDRATLGVNVQLTRKLGRTASVAVEATNLFDREAPRGLGLAAPVEGRGLRLQLRKSF